MAVLLETSKGDLVIDLFVDQCPTTCKNFIKLCKAKYYNNCLFHNVQENFIAQTGDPTGTGKGGSSIYGLMYGDQARFFDDEIKPTIRHKEKGMVGMASPAPNANASQFYMTTGTDIHSLDGKHTIFGKVGEGLDVLDKINEAFVDDSGRPLQNIRIRHTIVLDDPFDDPPELEPIIPPESPAPQFEQGDRLEDDWAPDQDTRDAEEVEEETRKAEAHNRAVVLEMIGDLPEADVKPPSNVIFICKLNPVTTEEDLEIIFSRFGHVVDCAIIRDWKTGDSLCYGFIGFETDASCEEAYFKMNNVLIDDRRIKVDFSQSVAHLWKQFKKGGKKGDMAMQKEADAHERQGKSNLEFKGQRLGGHGALPQGRGQHQLLVDDDGDNNNHTGPAPSSRHGPASQGRRHGDSAGGDLKGGRRYQDSRRHDEPPAGGSGGGGGGRDRAFDRDNARRGGRSQDGDRRRDDRDYSRDGAGGYRRHGDKPDKHRSRDSEPDRLARPDDRKAEHDDVPGRQRDRDAGEGRYVERRDDRQVSSARPESREGGRDRDDPRQGHVYSRADKESSRRHRSRSKERPRDRSRERSRKHDDDDKGRYKHRSRSRDKDKGNKGSDRGRRDRIR